MRQIILCAALVAAIANSCPAFGQTAAGDWHGTIIRAPVGEIRLGLHIEEPAPGTLTGQLIAVDQGLAPTPLADVKRDGATLSFAVPASRASFNGAWDAAANSWTGTYKHPAGDSPATFAPGPHPPLPPLPAVAGLDGSWEAKLQGIMPVIIRVSTDASGSRAYMDVPAQQVANIPLRSLTRNGARVAFSIPVMMMNFEGELAGDKIEGTLTQAGRGSPFLLVRTSAAAAPARLNARTQTPKPPFPYRSEDVAFDNLFQGDVRLACTLTTPPGPPAPVAILISGSGPQDRNADVLGHQTFAVLADHLARKNIAALRCDDRDFGKSPEYSLAQRVSDFVTDARSAAAFLRTRTDIDPGRIGFIGHSLGAVIAPVAASEEPDTAFVVLLAGLGVTGIEAAVDQRVALASGAPTAAELAEIRALWSDVQRQLAWTTDHVLARAIVRDALDKTPKARPEVYPTVDIAVEAMSSAYARSMSAYEPARFFEKIDAPILALNGALDVQAPAKQNVDGLRKLTAGKDATVLELPGLNHAFQHARTGAMDEYASIEETFAAEALALISDWLLQKTAR